MWEYWDTMDQQRAAAGAERPSSVRAPSSLPGMDYRYEESLAAAQKSGAKSLRAWLDQYQSAIQDPRLAWIELDYVLLVSKEDPIQAKKTFAKVKKRVQPGSPVYQRVKDLEKTYE
jgi:hypothetical protein